MDLRILRKRTRAAVYTHHDQFRADVKLLHTNSLLFNGPNHLVTIMASNLVSAADKVLEKVCMYMYVWMCVCVCIYVCFISRHSTCCSVSLLLIVFNTVVPYVHFYMCMYVCIHIMMCVCVCSLCTYIVCICVCVYSMQCS